MAGDDGKPRDERKPVPFKLTPRAHAGLHRLATRHHTTMVTLIEALGVLGHDGDPTIAELADYARRLDAERRNRQENR